MAIRFLSAFLVLILIPIPLSAQGGGDFKAEVMSLEGSASVSTEDGLRRTLNEGDLVNEGDSVRVADGGRLDIAFDKDWDNVAELAGGSEVSVESIHPTRLVVSRSADVLAKLKRLPKDSEFQVQTPTAIATVRGSEYRTLVENGQTQVFNLSDSPVYVFGAESEGNFQSEPVVVQGFETTSIPKIGELPRAPRQMSAEERAPMQRRHEAMRERIHKVLGQGRVGRIQDMQRVEQRMREHPRRPGPQGQKKSEFQPGPPQAERASQLTGPEPGPQSGPQPGAPQPPPGEPDPNAPDRPGPQQQDERRPPPPPRRDR